jgi:cytochrome P450
VVVAHALLVLALTTNYYTTLALLLALTTSILRLLLMFADILQETMRTLPVVPIIMRKANKDVTVGGYEIAEGTHIAIHVMAMNNSSRYWDRADEFLPVRPTSCTRTFSRSCYGLAEELIIIASCHLIC